MTVCVVCRRREGDAVCEDDRVGIAKMLTALPGRYERLQLLLLPGQGLPSDPRVTQSRTGAPLPVRTGVLSSLAGGSDQVSGMLHPLVRRWQTRRTAMVSRVAVVGGVATIVEEEKEIVDWHRSVVRDAAGRVVQVPDDDQIGTLPPREWLDTQARYWRSKFGHHVPSRTPGARAVRLDDDGPVTVWPARPPGEARTVRVARLSGEQLMQVCGNPAGTQVASYLHAVDWWWQQQINARLGLYDGHPAAERPMDPLADEIQARFGTQPRSLAMAWDVKYLLTHLNRACDLGEALGVDTFAAELAALTAEIQRVLGEEPKDVWIGRCPTWIAEPDTGVKHPCGAGLRQDPDWAQVVCPHCHATHDTRGPAGRTLAREIRKVWPVDRRRRYNADDMAAVVPPRCPGCTKRVMIEWREVTGVGERTRWWQPRKSRCESGCANAGRAI